MKQKIKVGDWVWSNCSNVNKGEIIIGKVTTVDSEYDMQPCIKIDGGVWNYPSQKGDIIRLLTKEELAQRGVIENPVITKAFPKNKVEKQLKQKEMSEIKEYKVITTFPTATKDYQVGEIIKKGTALFKKAHKFPKFFEAILEEQKYEFVEGNIVVIDKKPKMWSSLLSEKDPLTETTFPFVGTIEKVVKEKDKSISAKIEGYGFCITDRIEVVTIGRKPTKAELAEYNKIKVGDWVTDDNGKNYYKVGRIEGNNSYPSGDSFYSDGRPAGTNSSFGGGLRKLKTKEIVKAEALYKSFASTKIVVSNNDIGLLVRKDGTILVEGKGKIIQIKEVQALLEAATKISGLSIGPWTTSLASYTDRFIRIGCSEENFRVSVSDLKLVIETYNRIK